MKKLLCLILIALATTSCGTEKYPRTMTVTEIDTASDTVILTDYVGHEWSFYGVEDWMVGDICSCIMDDNGTENITDDIIISTRYGGRN